jgi:putative ABC transport system ATP-binding protein
MVDSLVSIRSGAKGLPSGPLLTSIDLDLAPRESIAILGRSGSGKSTLLSVVGLLDRFDSGSYRLGGVDVQSARPRAIDSLRAGHVGFVFQHFALLAHLTALENVMAPLRHLGKESEARMRNRAMQALESVGIASLSGRRPKQLSGGEKQRVAIARALVNDPVLLLADEPTGSLDNSTGEAIVELLLDQVNSRGAGLLLVTHDTSIAAQMSRTARLVDGTLDFEEWT